MAASTSLGFDLREEDRRLTPLGLTIESRLVVIMGLLPAKIQCAAFQTAARAAREKTWENVV